MRAVAETGWGDSSFNCLELAERGGRADLAARQEIEARLQGELERLDGFLERVHAANRPSVMPAEEVAALEELAAFTFAGSDGQPRHLLSPDELKALSIPRGSLTEDEREEIESHVTFTYRFLSRIPWTGDLKNIPAIAYAHHEKLDGCGYPRRLVADRIPLQARLIAVADLYDALTAAERPYKKAVPHERAIEILRAEAAQGALDADLVRIFIEREVHQILPPPDAPAEGDGASQT